MTQRLFGVVGAIALAIMLTQTVHARTSKATTQAPKQQRIECFRDEDRPGAPVTCSGAAADRRAAGGKVKINDGWNAYAAIPRFGGVNLADVARRYEAMTAEEIGLRRRSLWCGEFMNMVLARAGYRGTGSDMAQSFAGYGARLPGPRVGAIAVMSRVGGGHVGVVVGDCGNDEVRIISGNTWSGEDRRRRVAEGCYRRGRIYAYVEPRA